MGAKAFSMRLSEDVWKAARTCAAAQGLTLAGYVRSLLIADLRRRGWLVDEKEVD